MAHEFRLPDLGEGLTEAELVSWAVDVGQTIALNQVIGEVETAKALVELPSPYAGVVEELLVSPGTTVPVGTPIIRITTDAGTEEPPARTPVLVGYGPGAPAASKRARRKTVTAPEAGAVPDRRRPDASPAARAAARELGIDLDLIAGTGPSGAVTRSDVEARTGSARPDTPPAPESPQSPERETRTPIRSVRKQTADAMVRSAFTAPHVTEFVTVDVTRSMELLDRLRELPEFEGLSVTPLTLVAKAMVVALRENPSLNASWDGEHQEIVTKHYVNLGIAAATPRGLVVPNVKEAQTLSLLELCRAITELTATARSGRATPAQLTGGTASITNVGVFGVDAGTPILNPGESAILCLGSVTRRPWVHEDELAVRWVTTLSVSFDHRVVDGEQGSRFLASVAGMLHDPASLLAHL
ncbi:MULTISPECIES: dihydrolipoamide acetyltransferase family protein [unclassified Rhodococcus (in: high G+C Gram-positive bacteria)]|uniref:dihydrolipoamide acetyltransferase family protein n=1 Tax=unclassified Rhodococcus (in: high G+C Gram-positive bacteria) TaxID=192944 RepID=UPI001639D819|nr:MULTISPECIES: dihydrolipoamide acetyltransferase family protein [unclassified Rhodococcus (in: high G+C Gram-positive bacteria)]MBC2639002.1 2-oxo acid dehydrogenase subunit E2 [Rhodococcus sp. 3A]MBC2896257.1 2-oxo acid dehydrogenase subunit E2 [Rhodococcus sp. 4CII]